MYFKPFSHCKMLSLCRFGCPSRFLRKCVAVVGLYSRNGKVRVGKQSLLSLSLTTTQGVDRVGWTFIHDVKDNKKDEIGGFQDKGMLWETGCVHGIPQVSHMGVHDE